VQALPIYERPTIEVLKGVDAYFERIFQRKLDVPAAIDWRASKIKEYIDTHPLLGGQNLNVVCKQLGLSMSGRQARRLFKVSTGVGIRDYAKNRRLSVAVEQLEATNVPVKAIAADLGYQSARQFRRRFKEYFGLSPLDFRKARWNRDLGTGHERSP